MQLFPGFAAFETAWERGENQLVWARLAADLDTPVSLMLKLADAREDVTRAWAAEALVKALSARAAEIKAEMDAGAAIGSFGIVDITPEINRDGTVTDTPSSLLAGVFAMAEAEVRVIEADGFVAVIELDRILPVTKEGPDAEAMQAALIGQAQQAIAADAFAAFAAALTNEAGISLDQAVINAVNTSLP